MRPRRSSEKKGQKRHADAVPNQRRWSIRRWLGRGALVFLVLGALVVALFYVLTVRSDRRSAPYRRAMKQLRATASATRLLGTPVEAGWWVRGRVGADSAALAIPVRGPRREGVLHAEAQTAGGDWVFARLELAVDDAALRVSLLPGERRRRRAHDSSRTPPLRVPPRYQE
jgi:hypothetical protein